MSKKCFTVFACIIIGFSVGFIIASLIFNGAFVDMVKYNKTFQNYLDNVENPKERDRIQRDFNRLDEWAKEQHEKDPCKTFQDYLDKPRTCAVHYLIGVPNFDVAIYLAEDGSVRWKAWLKETK